MNPILTVEDQPDFFPCLGISGGELAAAIAVASAKAEGPLGAMRKLGITTWEENPIVNGDAISLAYWPIVLDDEGNPDVSIQVKVSAGESYTEVPTDSYEVNIPDGRINFLEGAIDSIYALAQGSHSFRPRWEYNSQASSGLYSGYIADPFSLPDEFPAPLRISYKAGWDFSADGIAADHDAMLIKSMVAQLLIAAEESKATVVKKETLVDFKMVEYASSAYDNDAAQILESFKQYRPRSTF